MITQFITELVELIGKFILFPIRSIYGWFVKTFERLKQGQKIKRGRPKTRVTVKKKKKTKRKLFKKLMLNKILSFSLPSISFPKIRLKALSIHIPTINFLPVRILITHLITDISNYFILSLPPVHLKLPKLRFKGFLFGFLTCVFLILFPLEVYRWVRELPNPSLLMTDASRRSTRILDRNGKLLYEIYVNKKFDPVKIEQIPNFVQQATLAAEDANFYKHGGLDLRGIVRAAWETVFGNNLQGGSTITQQLVKNVLLTPERTLTRKIKEAFLSLVVEGKYSKKQILEMYLNNTPYGGTAWGVQAAAQKFFGKNVSELTLAEAAMLAGLPSAPTIYSPLTNIEAAKMRQKYVLSKMVGLGEITQDQADRALNEELVFADQSEFIRAPHFVNYVRQELVNKYGPRMVEFGGLTVTTTLDLDLYDKVQKIVSEEVATQGVSLNFSNGSAVVLDPKKAEILAYVGSIDYFKEDWGSYDVVTANRQPGSSIKPVTYSLALTKNYTAASIIKDEAISYPQANARPYTPVNYDGRFHGNVTLRQALANSYNIPAVKLAASVGLDNIVTLGHDMGLSNWSVGNDYGLSVTLGGKEVRLLDLANVYGTLARKGIYKNLTSFISIKDGNGYEMYDNSTPEKKILSEEVSYLMWNILSDNIARTPAFGPSSYLVVPGYTVAVKTGTTDLKKDNWTLGFTPSYVVGVWVGNNDGRPMNPYLASGLSGAAPIWNRIFKEVLNGKPNELYSMPNGLVVNSDKNCGRSELFIKGSGIPKNLCPVENKEKDKKKD